MTTSVAILGSGNIGTDLMIKIQRAKGPLRVAAMVGIDPDSEGLRRARALGVATSHDGVAGLLAMREISEVAIVLDATSAQGHVVNDAALQPLGKRVIDLTPAAIGPYVVPTVNLGAHLRAPNINMVTCGGQATIPIVAALSGVTSVPYAEIVSSIASRSAGPGTRANIDEFTETTARAVAQVGGARRGKAIIVLNPADPPVMMRGTVNALLSADTPGLHEQLRTAVVEAVAAVAVYVPGYRLAQDVQILEIPDDLPLGTLVPAGEPRPTHQVSVLLEVEGSAHFLPAYAGNLDIMTSAAIRVAEGLATTPESVR